MKDQNDVARLFIRHLLKQVRELFTENWILRHLFHHEVPSVPKEVLDKVIKLMMENPETTKKVREPFDLQAENVMEVFEKQLGLMKTKMQVIESEKEVDALWKKLVELMSQLPPPKMPN